MFSSEVAKAAGLETLIRSPDCGSLSFTDPGSQKALAALNSMDVNDTLAATTYSRACYGNLQNLLQCTQYPQQQLPWTVNQNATCPFTNDLCIFGDTSAYEMDTGHIDSHQALGINAPMSERIQYRKVTTCKPPLQPFLPDSYCVLLRKLSHDSFFCPQEALLIQRNPGSPIHTKGYATTLNDTSSTDIAYGDTLQQFAYGPILGVSNYTYQYDTHNLVGSNSYSLT